jgi:hypothetical protein
MHYTMAAPGGKNSLQQTAGVSYGRLMYPKKTAWNLPGERIGNESEKRICRMQISKRGGGRARV